jgi:hypothetical protein
MSAQALWCQYASEISSDLSRYHHRRIADWHRGVLKSQELLELLEHMDDAGAFKTALRGGEPSEQQKAILQIANETAVLRAGQLPGADGEQWGSQLFFTPEKIRELVTSDQERAEVRSKIMAIGGRTKNDGR